MEKVKILKGWYRSAGHKYGWANSGYLPEGVGINRDALYDNDEIEVHVAGNKFKVDCKEAIEFVKMWRSHYKMDGGTKIGVISRSIMVKI